ncbi:MAG: hypothetical protein R3F04_10965 [Lysobacteraceae bacterium]
MLIAAMACGLLACHDESVATLNKPSATSSPAREATAEAEPGLATRSREGKAALTAWWNRPEVLAILQLSPQQQKDFERYLSNQELGYQLASANLKRARTEQIRMIEDPQITRDVIEAFHREHIQSESTSMLEANIQARLWVRERLSPQQLQALLLHDPRFFRASWFRRARGELQQGSVGSKP